MNKLYIIAYRNTPFRYLFKKIEKKEDVVVIENGLAAPKNWFLKITRFLFVGKCFLPLFILQLWFDRRFLNQLKLIQKDDVVLVFENINLRALGMLYYLLPQESKKYNWFGNPIYPLFKGKDPAKRLEQIKKLGFKLVTFDSEDAFKYKMSFHNQFLRFPEKEDVEKEDIDFYFLGEPKDREKYLVKLQIYLEKIGYVCKFMIPHTSDDFITYKDNIEFVKRSKCIVDVYQYGQSGITRRPLEALFYNKKLLTNNLLIKDMDFYHPNNIYLLQDENFEGIVSFMEKPVYQFSDDFKKKYDVESWLTFFK